MARQSHAQRVANYKAKHPGATQQEARGHGATLEHKPTDAQLSDEGFIQRNARFLGDINRRRREQGKAQVVLGGAPFGASQRSVTFDNLREADAYASDYPSIVRDPKYMTIYIGGGGVTVAVERGSGRRRRAA